MSDAPLTPATQEILGVLGAVFQQLGKKARYIFSYYITISQSKNHFEDNF